MVEECVLSTPIYVTKPTGSNKSEVLEMFAKGRPYWKLLICINFLLVFV